MSSAAVIGSRLDEAFSDVFALLLSVLQRVRGFLGRGRGSVCLAAWGVRTGSGLVRPRRRAARRFLSTGSARPVRDDGLRAGGGRGCRGRGGRSARRW